MKKLYSDVDLEVINIEGADVITNSVIVDNTDNGAGDNIVPGGGGMNW